MGSEDVVVSSPAHELETGLRLRPIKTTRVQQETGPSTSYLEETWEDEPMTPAGRCFFDPIFDCLCVCILGFKQPIDTEIFRHHVEMTIMKHKRFSSRAEIRDGRPWWTQVKTNVKDHVLETQLTAEQTADKDFVLDYTTDVLVRKPFDRSKPLWDVHLLDARLGDAVSCAVVRIHHALGDGTSLISLLIASTRKTAKPDMLPTLPTSSGTKESSKPNLSSFCTRLFLAVWRFFIILWYSLTEIGKFIATLMWLKDTQTPIKGAAGCEHLPKKYRFMTVDVDDLKFVSKAVGGTINDAFVAMAACGLRKYIEYRIENDAVDKECKTSTAGPGSAEEKKMNNQSGLKSKENSRAAKMEEAEKLSKLDKARVRALAMINTRPAPGLPELADMMSGAASQARWGNHMGYLLLEIPMKQPEDPLDLVRAAMDIGNKKKTSLEGPFTYASGSLVMSLLGAKIASHLVYRSVIHTTVSMSNVKGPDQEVMFAENPITHIIPSVIGQPHSLCLHLQSYQSEVFLVAMAAKDIIPDPEYLLQLCMEALQEMKKSAVRKL